MPLEETHIPSGLLLSLQVKGVFDSQSISTWPGGNAAGSAEPGSSGGQAPLMGDGDRK